MAQTNINVRMEEQVKADFDSICNELGMTMTTAITIFAKKMIREQRIPFEVSITPNATTEDVIEKAVCGEDLYGPFDSVDEMMEALNA